MIINGIFLNYKIDKLYYDIQFHNKEIIYLNTIFLFICLKHFSSSENWNSMLNYDFSFFFFFLMKYILKYDF